MWLAEFLDEQMHQRRWAQQDLADRVGVSQAAVSKWLLQKSTPDIDQAISLARATDQDLLEFLGRLWPEIEQARHEELIAKDRVRRLRESELRDLPAAADRGTGRRGRPANRPHPEPGLDD